MRGVAVPIIEAGLIESELVLIRAFLSLTCYKTAYLLQGDYSCCPAYSSLLTGSSHTTSTPCASASCMARCTIVLPAAAPCQCRSFGAIITVSPGCISCTDPPST